VLWAAPGPHFHFSEVWQMVINTSTTIITFLMVFLIQNTQNRDARALHLKLDEVIRALHTAHNEMIDIERLSDQELEHLAKHYEKIRQVSEHRKSSRHAEEPHGQLEDGSEDLHGREEASQQKKAG
jgi:low affinity Fe/Cu permease